MSGAFTLVPALALITAAACGGGAWVLHLARIDKVLDPRHTIAAAFVLGTGILGWAAFLTALVKGLHPLWLTIVCLILATGLLFLGEPIRNVLSAVRRPTPRQVCVVALIAIALFFDFLEALPPPADADSLAYHFARPREFLAAGKIVFIPRASDGVHPVIQQMTYTIALELGGERALTLWAMLSGWGTAAILYAFARSYLSRIGSMALVLIFLTTPAVVYGAGTGQHEVRSAGFVLAAVMLAIAARKSHRLSYAVLAGLAAGFFAASKYTGLLFLPLIGLALIARRRWLTHGFAYTAAALLVTTPFYGWIWWNTGDPFYPMLYGFVDYRPETLWSADFQAEFRSMFSVERPLPATMLWAFAYPFFATLAPYPVFESDRTGFGPLALLILPLALAGVWAHRKTVWRSSLSTALFVCAGFYFVWFFFGPSQRVRHFLPLYPLLLLCLVAASERAIQSWPALTRPLYVAVAATIVIQFIIHAVFTVNHARFTFSNEPPQAFLRRNVSSYDVVEWVNAHLSKNDRLLHMERQLVYYLPPGSFYGNSFVEPRIDLRATARDVGRFWDELAVERMTHLLVSFTNWGKEQGGYVYLAEHLLRMGCAQKAASIRVSSFRSRTIAHLTKTEIPLDILKLTPESCPLE